MPKIHVAGFGVMRTKIIARIDKACILTSSGSRAWPVSIGHFKLQPLEVFCPQMLPVIVTLIPMVLNSIYLEPDEVIQILMSLSRVTASVCSSA